MRFTRTALDRGGSPFPPPGAPRAHGFCRGISLPWLVTAMFALSAFCSLGVDVGRVLLVKAELQNAADAAARHAATGLGSGGAAAARDNALDVAGRNLADGSPVALNATQDVEVGAWTDADGFTLLTGAATSSANAVRVTARREASRQNAVPLLWARLLGMSQVNLRAVAVARLESRPYGIVGLDSVSLSGSSDAAPEANSYRSKSGSTASTGTTRVYSNGNVSISGAASVAGDARPGPSGTTTVTGGAAVSGSTLPLPTSLVYPAESAGAAATYNDNWRLPPGSMTASRDISLDSAVTLPGGTYYLNNVRVGGSGSVAFTGPTTVYLTGSLDLSGNVTPYLSAPSNLRVVMVNSGTTFKLEGNSVMYGDVYAPGTAFTSGGSGTLYGSLVARSIAAAGNSRLVYDESFGGGLGITLVK